MSVLQVWRLLLFLLLLLLILLFMLLLLLLLVISRLLRFGFAAAVAFSAEAFVQRQFQGVGLPFGGGFLCVLLFLLQLRLLQASLAGDGAAEDAEEKSDRRTTALLAK